MTIDTSSEDWDYEDYESCEHCGEDMQFEDCHDCGGEGISDDLHEEDPLWYDPGTYETCPTCSGKGGWYICKNKQCKPLTHEQ